MTSQFKTFVASSLALVSAGGAAALLIVSSPNAVVARQGTMMGKAGAGTMTTKATKDAAKSSAAAQKAIKGEEGKADPSKPVKRPASKGGKKSRSGEGILRIDSRVDDPVAIYVDGYYRGTVSAYGDMYFTADADTYECFGKCGHGYTWGPKNITVYSGRTNRWTLSE